MDSSCSCGAKLVEDAQFCHRCGKPVAATGAPEPLPESLPAEEPSGVTDSVEPVAEATGQPPAEISFHNAVAVRVALIAAALTFIAGLLFGQVSGVALLQLLLVLVTTAAGGFYAVFLYRRRTGITLSPRSGARLGWITGVFGFVINMVMLTLVILSLSDKGGLAALMRARAESAGMPAQTAGQLDELLASPAMMTTALLLVVMFLFMSYTVAASAGGALGAKVMDRE